MKGRRARVDCFIPTFVDSVPARLEEGRLYVALRYRTVTHLCACGCGVEVNTPLHPTGWALTYDGVTVSLWPSVGSWSEKCRSHYVVDKNRVRWSRSWSCGEVQGGRARRQLEIEEYYGTVGKGEGAPAGVGAVGHTWGRLGGVMAWLRRWGSGWRRC